MKYMCEECGGIHNCVKYAGNWYCRAHYLELLQPEIEDILKWLINLMNNVSKNGELHPEAGEFSDAELQAKHLLDRIKGKI